MTGVLALLNYIVSVLLSLLGITQSRADQITVNKILAILTDPVVGLNALHGEITTVLADLASIEGDVLALGTPQQSGSPVTLPAVAPAGYGGLDASGTGAAVWNYANYAGYAMGDTMRSLVYFFDGLNSQLAFPSPTGGPFVITANIGAFNAEPWLYTPDYGVDSILTTDADVGSWLNRVAARGETWSLDTDSLYWRTFGLGNPANNTTWYCTLSEVQFKRIQALIVGTSVVVAPVWPGLANVTLGTPVALTGSGVTVVGPMHGVIFNFSGVTPAKAYYDFQGKISWRYVGQVAFEDDNGDLEFPQSISFETSVVCPTTMAEATFCQVRLGTVTLTGTVTPWTRN